jgi:hypothetical protein
VGPDHPRTIFVVTSGSSVGENVAGIEFGFADASYLAGMLAGAMTKSNVIGVIGGTELPPVRDSSGVETPRKPYEPCDVPYGEAGWPSLEPAGTIRQPSGGVRFGNGSMSWYPRQCVSDRCGRDQPLVSSRGQALDHVAFAVDNLDALITRLRAAKVKVLEGPYTFANARAYMIEDPDGLGVELIDRASAPATRTP